MNFNPRHFYLRPRTDRNGKKARCSCGWEGRWRITAPSGSRRADARIRTRMVIKDFENHLATVEHHD